MTNDEIIQYAKSVGIDDIEEILKENPFDEKSYALFTEAMLLDNAKKILDNEGSSEKALLPLLDLWLREGDINGKTINQTNLDRLNKVNILSLLFFKKIKGIEFEAPNHARSFAQTFIRCEEFSIEDEKAKNRKLFNELVATADEINVTTTANRQLLISIGVNNIWVE